MSSWGRALPVQPRSSRSCCVPVPLCVPQLSPLAQPRWPCSDLFVPCQVTLPCTWPPSTATLSVSANCCRYRGGRRDTGREGGRCCQLGVLPALEPPSLPGALPWWLPALCAATGALSLVLHRSVEPQGFVCLSVLHHTRPLSIPCPSRCHRATRAVCPSVPLLL